MTKRSRWFRWFAIATIILLGVAAIVISQAVDVSSQKREQLLLQDWAWSAVQLRTEAAELETRVMLSALSGKQSSIEAAIHFHQLLLGRTRTWGSGSLAIFLNQDPRMMADFDRIVSEASGLGDILSKLPDRDSMAQAIAQARTLRRSVERLGISAHTYSVAEMARVSNELRGKQNTQKVLIAFLFLFGLTLFLLLSWQNRSLTRANAAISDSAMKLTESEKRLSGVLETTSDGVLVLDREYRVKFANKHAIAMLFSDRPFLGLPLWVAVNTSPDSEVYANYRTAFEQQTVVNFESYFAPMDMWLEDHVFPTAENITIFFRDVTERRRQSQELLRQAKHDPLTNLANRALFTERLALGLQGGRRQSGLMLVMIDLDDFKAINDYLGHLAGDSLLRQFATRLAGLVRQGDTIARFGGDEFAIIQLGPVEPGGGPEVARRISEALLTPFDIQGTEILLGASIGIAMAPQHGTLPDELVRNADIALYCAKKTKGTSLNYCMFEPGMESLPQVPPQLDLRPDSIGPRHSRRNSRPTLTRLTPP